MNEPWHIRLLGGLRAEQGGRVITRFRSRKTAALLAYLALHLERPHPREILVDLFWPDASPEAARNSLSQALSSLRHQLEPPGVPFQAVIRSDNYALSLNPNAITTDVQQFEVALGESAKATDFEARNRMLLAAVEMYTGELLPGFYDDWVILAQQRLAVLHADAVSWLVEHAKRTGNASLLMQVAQRALQVDPFDEEAQAALTRRPSAPGGSTTGSGACSGQPSSPVPPASDPCHFAPRRERLRAGTYAFLFAPEAAADLRSTVAEWGGRSISTRKDSVFLFPQPGEALSCALAYQERCQGPGRAAVSLFIDIRTVHADGDLGPILEGENPDFGGMSDGAIRCSAAAAFLLKRELPAEIALRAVGTSGASADHWIDRSRSEPLYEIGHEASRPPSSAGRGAVPLQFNRFFGREIEIARLEEMLGAVRLVTLTGPGGTGKTRLAAEMAARFVRRLEGRVWFVPLADLEDPLFIGGRIRDAMGLTPVPDMDPLEQVVSGLSSAPADSMLVLDNLEHLVETGRPIVEALINRVPSLRVLVTSRQRLHLPGEKEIVVTPLAVPCLMPGDDVELQDLRGCASVQLFVDRAQAARSDFQITPRNAASIAALCTRLEGIPLALELAAARSIVLTPSQMLARLGKRLDFLSSRRGEPRHRTLRGAIEWSCQLLTPELQRFFAVLSVFAGGFTVEAAEEISGDPLALDHLEQLRDCSLLTADSDPEHPRFHMLDLIREFAAEMLAESPPEKDSLQWRHSHYFLSRASRWSAAMRTAAQRAALDEAAAEFDNLRAAVSSTEARGDWPLCIDLSLALSSLLYYRGLWGEAWHLLATADTAALHLDGDRLARARVAYEIASLALDRGETVRARTEVEKALDLWTSLCHIRGTVQCLNLSGLIATEEGDHSGAHRAFEAALRSCPESECDLRGRILHNLGRLAFHRGDDAEAKSLYASSLEHRRAASDVAGEALTLGNLGVLAYRAGHREAAREYYLDSLTIRRALGDIPGTAAMLNNLAEIAELEGQIALAVPLYIHAERLFRDLQSAHRSVPAARAQELLQDLDPDSRQALIDSACLPWDQFVPGTAHPISSGVPT